VGLAARAVGLNYGVFRRKEFNATTQNILFYDMGSTSTIATVAGLPGELF
jgi:hypoxia up-regulated 1